MPTQPGEDIEALTSPCRVPRWGLQTLACWHGDANPCCRNEGVVGTGVSASLPRGGGGGLSLNKALSLRSAANRETFVLRGI